jgi:uncharacterized phage-associated protein|tara:strand:+ start:121 stop:567 length:447 start_codon:yes stop_codon:yes gene_type:complete
MSISAMEAARTACEISGWNLSNLQLHKILYIAHMIFTGRHDGQPLIGDEQFQAWDYGPVLPTVYRHASSYGASNIQNLFHHVPPVDTSTEEYTVIRDAVIHFAQRSPFDLVDITHQPVSAWAQCYRPGERFITIDQGAIMDEYRNRFS